MEHIAWKGRIKPGCKAEYQRRHAEIWPEMVEVPKASRRHFQIELCDGHYYIQIGRASCRERV